MGRNSLKYWLYAGPLFALLILTIIIVSLKKCRLWSGASSHSEYADWLVLGLTMYATLNAW